MAQALVMDVYTGYTYGDYVLWNDEAGRCELIDGDAYMMASPSRTHQRILRILFTQFSNYLEGKSCEVFCAPFDVRLFPTDDDSDTDVVQPDIFVVCDPEKLDDERAVKGAPDLIIEIVSPGSKAMDAKIKKELYLRAGVREYWLVVSSAKIIVHYRSESGAYEEVLYQAINGGLEIPVSIFNNQLKIGI